MDSANTGMRSRSTGSSGAGRRHWRRTYQAPTSRPAPSSHQPEGREESAPPARTPSCSPPRKIRLNMRMLSSTSSGDSRAPRSEEHTSELQSPCNLVCRLLLEKKKKKKKYATNDTLATSIHTY